MTSMQRGDKSLVFKPSSASSSSLVGLFGDKFRDKIRRMARYSYGCHAEPSP
jgi:hypothetical protein